MAQRKRVFSTSDKDLLDYSTATIEAKGVLAFVTEEHDHGVIYHLWVEGVRNLAQARKFLGITDPNEMVALKITRETFDLLNVYLEEAAGRGEPTSISELIYVALKVAHN